MRNIYILFLMLTCVFIGSTQEELQLLDHWKVDTIPGSRAYNNAYNEVWGFVANGNEYGVIGSTIGTHIFDLSNPSEIQEIHFIKGAEDGIIHRDYHDYKGYLYAVADEGSSTLQIIDISMLPDSVNIIYDSRELIRRSHNIFIDTTSARLYSLISAGTEFSFSPMRVFSLEDPENPIFLADYNSFDGISVSQVHDAFIQRDTAYLNCGPSGMMIVDITDLENPEVLSYVAQGEFELGPYNHSGWLSEDGSAYYVADEFWGEEIKVFDVRNPSDINLSTTLNAGSSSNFSIPHNQVVACDYLYSSYYYDGLQVYDISDPLNPIRSHYYSTSNIGHRLSYEGAWGVYPLLPSGIILVSDMQEGLFVLQGPEDACQETTTVEKINDENISVYPIPARRNQKIQIELNEVPQKITLLSIDGKEQEVKIDKHNNLYQLDLSNRTGLTNYGFLKVYYQDRILIKKIAFIE